MRPYQRFSLSSLVSLLVLLVPGFVLAQSGFVRPLITQPVNEKQLTVLRGNIHPLARAEFDRGAVPASLPMERMLLVLKRSPEQQAALGKLMDGQQDRTSPNFHKWLTPEEFGKQFGPSDEDIATINTWLQSRGFAVTQIAKSKMVIEFSGNAGQVQQALGTSIHKYMVGNEEHLANSDDPQIPAALTPVVAGIVSLHNFRKQAQNQNYGIFSRSKTSAIATPITPNPLFTFPGGCDNNNNCYGIGPYDFATIYNLLPLWNAGLDGTGQTIAIVGRTNINIQDARDFRSIFNLPVNDPQIILNGPDPGVNGDESEANIDVQWSGATAPRATIKFVTSMSTETTDGVDLSALYIVDNNLAGVMSESYGLCELGLGTGGNVFASQLWEQAAAQGITVFVSTGDNGAAGCDFNRGFAPQPATFGLAVNGLASTPFNVAVGGTDFNQFTNSLLYWNTSNDPTTQASAKGYIPEMTWNSTCTNQLFAQVGFSSNLETNCNNAQLQGFVTTIGGSGGASNCTTNNQSTVSSCSQGYAKPPWQTGTGVPADGKRDIPDVSLFASNGFLGSFYVICLRDSNSAGTCDLNSPFFNFAGFGGTSVSSPAFAGIMAIVNQKMSARQGNANFTFYKLAAQAGASCNSSTPPASTCTFNDVTVGTISMPCLKGSPNCTTANNSHQFGVLSGYDTKTAYDLATGLGSVNAANMVNKWNTVTFRPSATTLTLNSGNPVNITHGASINVNVGVAPQSGTGTPSGDVALIASTGKGVDGFTLSAGTAAGSTNLLPGGTYTVTAHYGGDPTFGGSDSTPVSVTVGKENSKTALGLVTFDFSGNIINNNATTAVYGSPYILRVGVTNNAGDPCAANPVACPSGAVALTDNNAPLDGGAFSLNSLGYTEDQNIQLSGGSHSVKAQYAGDSSFNASSLTSAITITRAVTAISTPTAPGAIVGNPFGTSVTVQADGSGATPTGTVSFFANGTPVAGTVTYNAIPNSTILIAGFLSTPAAFPTPGTYAITASYSGDTNYTEATSAATNVTVKFPTPGMSLQPSSFTVQAGTNLTLTATVISSNSTIRPTGTVTFSSTTSGTIPGTITYTPVMDGSGNLNLQASITFPATQTDSFTAQYNGDVNYPGSNGFSGQVTVTGTEFTLSPIINSVTVPRGNFGYFQMAVGLQSGTAPVTFSATPCTGLPAETTCSVSPSTVNFTSLVQVGVSTTGPHPRSVRQATRGRAPVWSMAIALSGLACVVLLGAPSKRRRWFRGSLIVVAFLLLTVGCGGGGSGGGGGGGGGGTDPGTPTGSYVVTVTATSGGINHNTTFTLIVQ